MPESPFAFLKESADEALEKGREFTLRDVYINSDERPVLVVRPATIANRGWRNAEFSGRQADPTIAVARIKGSLGDRPADVEWATLQVQIKAFAEHVVIGWRNVNYSTGAPVPFTSASCVELLEGLLHARPEQYFELREFVGSSSSAIPLRQAAETVAKNAVPGSNGSSAISAMASPSSPGF